MRQHEKSRNADYFSARLTKLLDERGISRAELARRMGIAWSSVDRWFNGSVPHRATLERLAEMLKVNGDWLRDGGALLAPIAAGVEHAQSTVAEQSQGYRVIPAGAVPMRSINVISWAHAGEAASYEELPQHWQGQVFTTCRDDRAFGLTVDGDSMEPRCLHGDVVVVMPGEEARSGCLVVAKLRNDGVVLRRYTVAGAGRIRLTAYNPLYPATEHDRREFHWIYPVESTVRKEWS